MAESNSTPERMSLTAATKEILFDVYGYSTTKAIAADGEHFQSERFTVGGHDWAFRYYPKGKGRGPYISVFLVLLSTPKHGDEVSVTFACELLDGYGSPTGVRRVSSFVSSAYGEWHGFMCFALRDDLEEHYLVDDCFSLKCMISVLKKPRSDD